MRTNRIYEIRLIVAGSRTFHDYKLAKEKLDRIVFGLQEDYPGAQIVIISGDAKGADQIGIRYAMERNDVICKGRHSGTCRVLGREKPWD